MDDTITSKVAFVGKAITVDVLTIDIGEGKTSVREIIRHPGAVVVLAQRADGKFVFVRQYRKAIESFLLETVAGTLEPGEDPAVCAARELAEESGYIAESLTPLGTIVPAPGYSEEKLYLFFARTGMTPGALCPDEDERIEVELLTSDQIEDAINQGALYDAKTLAAWLLFTRRQA
jgi:ADP-ribose pyrophosphatase